MKTKTVYYKFLVSYTMPLELFIKVIIDNGLVTAETAKQEALANAYSALHRFGPIARILDSQAHKRIARLPEDIIPIGECTSQGKCWAFYKYLPER